jgi:hypothetical protein
MNIPTQNLTIIYQRDQRGREGLLYWPSALGFNVPAKVIQRVDRSALRRQLGNVRRQVEDLIHRAEVGQGRAGNLLDEEAWALSKDVLPAGGLGAVVTNPFQPQIDTDAESSEIPWEMLEERHFICARGHRSSAECRFCPEDGTPTERRIEKLALAYHLTHLVHGAGRAGGEGKEFLFIEDPGGDLCNPRSDPQGRCQSHLETLRQTIANLGFDINLLAGNNATVAKVLNALANPEVVGVYYFGHGYFPREGEEGCLVLADELLSAGAIEKLAPTARFVFLNACWGAATRGDWDLESRPKNVAAAFAQGRSDKVVIAPLWPVINVQAAEAASEFFAQAARAVALGEALRSARLASARQYANGEPHLAWMAYRYFGDPNRTLPVPAPVKTKVAKPQPAPPRPRLFARSAALEADLFAFDLDPILCRAAKRRHQQGRDLASVSDLLAGLIRKGNLTRDVLGRLGADPDRIYSAMTAAARPMPKIDVDKMDAAQLQAFFVKWFLRDRGECAPDLVALLQQADLAAQQRPTTGDGQLITELDLLNALLGHPVWTECGALGLPAAEGVRAALAEIQRAGEVGPNGEISLAALDAEARRIVHQAHFLARQRRVYPISHRVLFAAFLLDENGFAARVCRQRGADPKRLCAFMITAAESSSPPPPGKEGEEETHLSFALSREACARVVLPMIQTAQARLGSGKAVTERALFQAFCEKASSEFKGLTRAVGALLEEAAEANLQFDPELLEVDLDELKATEPDAPDLLAGLTLRARMVVRLAHELAEQRGICPINDRLLLAAFLGNPNSATVLRLVGRDFSLMSLMALVRDLLGPGTPGPRSAIRLDSACEPFVLPVIQWARELAGAKGLVTERLLLRAFSEAAEPAFKAALRRRQPPLDLDRLAAQVKSAPAPDAKESGEGVFEGLARKPGAVSLAEAEPSQKPLADKPTPQLKPLPTAWTQDHFEPATGQMLEQATDLAQTAGWPEVRTPHLFAAMIGTGASLTSSLLRERRLDPATVRQTVLSLVPARPQPAAPGPRPAWGDSLLKVFTSAFALAGGKARPQINEEDILTALLTDKTGTISRILEAFSFQGAAAPGRPILAAALLAPTSRSVLQDFGQDLTDKARRGQIPKIVGRDREIAAAMESLLLTENANPLLIGEAGVGKTAVVEGLAACVAEGRCPKRLRSARIIELSAGDLVANTRLRGEFEQRIQQLLAEAQGDVILFIDEIHTIVGAGSAEGGLDAGNMLKTALARGELRLIGSTTHADYKRSIARDKALSRRFQPQMIAPPSREATIEILAARQPLLEQAHNVGITDEAKVAASGTDSVPIPTTR